MAARTPRRSFATPFVVTLAAAPACFVQSAPPPAQPQPQPQPQPAQPSDTHPVIVTNPPRPQPEPATPPPQEHTNPSVIMNPPRPQPASTSWHVYKTKDGCEAIVNVECPAGASCNPPPPQKYDCPSGIAMNKPITVTSQPDGTCLVEREPPKCPPHAMCNPPRPQTVTCPK